MGEVVKLVREKTAFTQASCGSKGRWEYCFKVETTNHSTASALRRFFNHAWVAAAISFGAERVLQALASVQGNPYPKKSQRRWSWTPYIKHWVLVSMVINTLQTEITFHLAPLASAGSWAGLGISSWLWTPRPSHPPASCSCFPPPALLPQPLCSCCSLPLEKNQLP